MLRKPRNATDLLVWIGPDYPTFDTYVEEAEKLGVAKRIGKIPQSIKLGGSFLFLAHSEGAGRSPRSRITGKIYGFCVIERLERVFDRPEAANEYMTREKKQLRKIKLKLTPVVGGLHHDTRRRCGWRSIGGYYLGAGPDSNLYEVEEYLTKFGIKCEIRSPIVVLSRPLSYTGPKFAGVKELARAEVLRGRNRGGPKQRNTRRNTKAAKGGTARTQ